LELVEIPDDADLAGLWDQKPADDDDLEAPDLWAELWRREKDGKGGYRYILRFLPAGDKKLTRPGGQITLEIAKLLARRPGSGRHAKSREESARYRSFAVHLAAGLRRDSKGGAKRKKPKHARRTVGANSRRSQMHDLQRLADGQMPDVLKSDKLM
jgi:hypothetical protein